MEQNRNTGRTYNSGRTTGREYRNDNYNYGTAAPAYETRRYARPEREYEDNRRNQHSTSRRQAQKRRLNVSPIGMLFVTAAFAFLAIVMINYVQLQGELTSTVKNVAKKQVALTNLVSANDEAYSRVISSVDINDIEQIARGELGMRYATEGQVITYTSVGNDYMRKVGGNN